MITCNNMIIEDIMITIHYKIKNYSSKDISCYLFQISAISVFFIFYITNITTSSVLYANANIDINQVTADEKSNELSNLREELRKMKEEMSNLQITSNAMQEKINKLNLSQQENAHNISSNSNNDLNNDAKIKQIKDSLFQAKNRVNSLKEQQLSESMQEKLEAYKEAIEELDDVLKESLSDQERFIHERNSEISDAIKELQSAESAMLKEDENGENIQQITNSLNNVDVSFDIDNGKDQFFMGEDVTIKKNEAIRGLVVIGGNVDILGEVENDVVVIGGKINILRGGEIKGDAVVIGGNISLEEGGKIYGERVLIGGTFSSFAEKFSNLDLQVNNKSLVLDEEESDGGIIRKALSLFFLLIAGGFMGMTFYPEKMKRIQNTIEKRQIATSILGILSVIAIIPFSIFLAITIIGIPIIPILYIGLLIGLWFSMPMFGIVFGKKIKIPWIEQPKSIAGMIFWGSLWISIISSVPVLGAIFLAFAVVRSLGAFILSKFGNNEEYS